MQKGHIIHLVETSLTEDDDENAFKLEGYEQRFIKTGNGKGIATYYSYDKFQPLEEVKMDKFQITKFKHRDLDIITVYRSQSLNSLELLEHLKQQI